eukprot:GHVU01140773.1.p1 GENE.GHVU01140773.1~~GHVU01140773.1.p1  ORF type:complete len:346 (+),score=85.58 GHVU01140773.1:817-1854(+)
MVSQRILESLMELVQATTTIIRETDEELRRWSALLVSDVASRQQWRLPMDKLSSQFRIQAERYQAVQSRVEAVARALSNGEDPIVGGRQPPPPPAALAAAAASSSSSSSGSSSNPLQQPAGSTSAATTGPHYRGRAWHGGRLGGDAGNGNVENVSQLISFVEEEEHGLGRPQPLSDLIDYPEEEYAIEDDPHITSAPESRLLLPPYRQHGPARHQQQQQQQQPHGYHHHDPEADQWGEHVAAMKQAQYGADNLIAEERAEGMRRIQVHMAQATQIFRDLASLVSGQGESINSVEGSIDSALQQTRAALGETQKTSKYTKSQRVRSCWMIGVTLLLVIVTFLYLLR